MICRRPSPAGGRVAALLACLLWLPVLADESSSSSLTIERKNDHLILELRGPGEHFVGFDTRSPSADQREVLSSAAALLKDVSAMFRPTLAANCRLQETEIGGGMLEAAGLAGRHVPDEARSRELLDHDPGGDRQGASGGRHRHDQGAGQASPAQRSDAVAAGGDEDPGSATGEIHARYVFECTRAQNLRDVMIPAFASFPETRSLDVTIHDQGDTRTLEVGPGTPLVSLR